MRPGGGARNPVVEGGRCYPASFSSPSNRGGRQVLPGVEGGGVDGGPGSGGGWAARTIDSDGGVSFNGLEFFIELQSGQLMGTQQSVNQPLGYSVYGQESQVESNMDWHHTEGDAHMEEDVDLACEDGVESESENYDDFLVRCEGDTDVEDCFPIHMQEVVDEVRSMAEMQTEGRVKDAKYKAEKTRKAKRRAIEGVVEDQGIIFSDQDSDDCKELIDSSGDDHAVDGNDVSKTKRKSTATKLAKRAYYDESRLNKDYQFLPNMCFEDVHQFRRALLNYHVSKGLGIFEK